MTLTVTIALLAAGCFAVASVLQHRGALRARRRTPLHPGLLAELARKRGWLIGVAAQATGVTLHLVAVNLGPLSVVQPVLTIGLVLALLLQRVLGRRVGAQAWLSAGLVVLGLSVFLAATPEHPSGDPGATTDWTPGLLMAGLLVAVTLTSGLLTAGTVRCVSLGGCAGVMMATSAALGKAWGAVLAAQGITGLVTGWQLWAGLACGAAGTLLSQTAFQAGPLGGSLAAMMAIDPVVGVGLGVVVFGEPFAAAGTLVARLVGLGLTLLGVGLLASAQRERRAAVPELASVRSA
ncbi:MAG TPA: DMT family transporter [Pseudonocardia sp.]|jgi:hypothetical protein